MKLPLKMGTWFTGIGAPEQAIRELNVPHRNVMAAEWDKYATQTYLANFTPEKMYGDVTKINPEEIEPLDLFVAGFPCQAFSLAGRRLGFEDVRGTLFFNTANFIKINQPAYFVLENVKGLLSHDKPKGSKSPHGRTFSTIINLLAKTVNNQETMFPYDDNLGYNIHYRVLNSKDFGVPQNRERVFIVGIRPDLPNSFRFPIGEPLKTRLKDVLEPVVDEKYYLSEKMVAGFISHAAKQKEKGNGFKFEPITNTTDQIAKCVTARVFKVGSHDNFIDEKTTENSIAKCITTEEGSRGYNNFIKEPTIVQASELRKNGTLTEQDICPTLMANTNGGDNQPLVKEVSCGAIRGRDAENPSNRETGAKLTQTLEINKDGITNTITTVQKDNVIIEASIDKIGHVGKEDRQGSRVYSADGISQTLTSISGGMGGKTGLYQTEHRIRRLTPLECFRLQGFPDTYNKPCSDSQTYKQAGNSITVNVIKAVLRNLLSEGGYIQPEG